MTGEDPLRSREDAGTVPDLAAGEPSVEHPGVRWQLSADRRRLTMSRAVAGGTLEGSFGWDCEPSEEMVRRAIDEFAASDTSARMIGQRDRHRWVGPVIVSLATGPPTWHLPRVQLKLRPRPSILVGWLRAAVALGWAGRRRHG